MHDFFKIINVSYSDREIGILTWWADELMKNCDAYCASGLTSEEHWTAKYVDEENTDWDDASFERGREIGKSLSDEWDFPEPPNICR